MSNSQLPLFPPCPQEPAGACGVSQRGRFFLAPSAALECPGWVTPKPGGVGWEASGGGGHVNYQCCGNSRKPIEAQPTSFPSLPPSLPLLGSWGETMFNLQRSVFKVTFQPGGCAADLPTRFNFCPHGVSDLRGLAKCSPPVLLASLPHTGLPPSPRHTGHSLSVPVNENIEGLL